MKADRTGSLHSDRDLYTFLRSNDYNVGEMHRNRTHRACINFREVAFHSLVVECACVAGLGDESDDRRFSIANLVPKVLIGGSGKQHPGALS